MYNGDVLHRKLIKYFNDFQILKIKLFLSLYFR